MDASSPVTRWSPRKRKHDWRAFLTEDEAAAVVAAERKMRSAKQDMAEARVVLDPIRNRAIHRAKYQPAGRSALSGARTEEGS